MAHHYFIWYFSTCTFNSVWIVDVELLWFAFELFPSTVNSEWMKWILYLPSDCRVALYELISLSISQYNSKGQTTTPETSCPTLYDKRVGSLTSPANHRRCRRRGLRFIYSPYPRRPERLTICRYNYKGSTFSSVILRFSSEINRKSFLIKYIFASTCWFPGWTLVYCHAGYLLWAGLGGICIWKGGDACWKFWIKP